MSDVVGLSPDELLDPQVATRQRFPSVDWDQIWDEPCDVEWIVEPILGARKGTALYSPAKVGKSLLALDMAVKASRGFGMFGYPSLCQPRRVLYVDYENDVRTDVLGRLKAMQHSSDELTNLIYLPFPSLAPLDTDHGGQELLDIVEAYRAEFVIIDTASRSISGPENDNDTWNNWYRFTGMRLKESGLGYLRIDHAGKDPQKGMRGGSSKSADVDAVWRLQESSNDPGLLSLRCEVSRFLIPKRSLAIRRLDDPLRHEVGIGDGVRDREGLLPECIEALDGLQVSVALGRDKALKVLRDEGFTQFPDRLVLAAQQERRSRSVEPVHP
jgi:hypothetical protein